MPRVFVVIVRGSGVPKEVAEPASTRGWNVTSLEVDRLTAGSGRRMHLLPRATAADLYVALHRDECAVLSSVRAFVRSTPEGALRDDRAIDIATFCRYKAFTLHLAAQGAGATWESQFKNWMADNSRCTGHSDPRCLPLHIFKSKGSFDLDEVGGRAAFDREHRVQRSRVDARRVTWSPARPGARHGREPVAVAGVQLVDGFHWDVSAARPTTIATADAVWKVKGYLNVYPDGASRSGLRSSLNWSRKDSIAADRRDHPGEKR